MSEQALPFAYVAVFNPHTNRPEVYQLLAAPFGATRSVYAFLRASHALWFTGAKGLKLMWSCFFDDYVVFSPDSLAPTLKGRFTCCFNCWAENMLRNATKLVSLAVPFQPWVFV